MKINELTTTAKRYRVYGLLGQKEVTWTGYADSKKDAAKEANNAFQSAGHDSVELVKIKRINPSDYNISEGTSEGRKGILGGAATEAELDEEVLDEWSVTHPGIKKELVKRGYTFLGSGVDQQAYLESSTGKVLKIFGTQVGTNGSGGMKLSRDQEMFVYFANYCMKNSGNPFLPKFDGFERFVYDGHTYFQIRMERLKKTNRDFGEALECLSDKVKAYRNTTAPTIFTKFQVGSPQYFEMITDKIGEKDLLDLIQTEITLNNAARDNGWVFDLHEDNYMMRGNTPVIIDPWVVPRR